MRITRKDIKGQNGKVLVVGGSREYVGAPALAAIAALRTGVDIVTVCAPERVAWQINSYSPDLMTRKFLGEELAPTHAKEIAALSEHYDVVLLGPGLGEKKEFVLKLLRDIKKPFVIDADALKVIALDVPTNSILTPNPKEFRILYENTVKKEFDELDMEPNIRAMQEKLGNNIMLLKGPEDIIFTKHRRHTNKTGHNSMTRGGTGDILAGICAGFLAQSGNLFDSAKEAAYINGRLGEFMYKQKSYGYTAFDMVEELWRFIK
ncbi:Sugar kinase, YjeF-related protein family [archaeon GW2011_AR15]|nr:Sugar kinase, YjeF-related protein family [archaeon GW2011_AR15]MBS3103881.1 NAD(P)H-hydrate dehydratase [Candidatus Woesearchaeota archaeon]